jgi:ComF family protein
MDTVKMMRLSAVTRSAAGAFLSLLYPPHCAHCAAQVEARELLCGDCLEKAKRIEPPFCGTCSQPFDGAIDGSFTCANCAQRHFHFDCAVSTYLSRGMMRDLIHRFKYQHDYRLRHQLADWLAESLRDARIQARPFDFLVPVPLHPARMREREFNQAAVLAGMLAERSGTPVLDCLRRVRYTTTQTRLDRTERMENLRNAFDLRKNMSVQGRHLILIDDVLTTGSTVDECARVLRKAGAGSVRVMTVARG